jgi:hypothetical protein
MRTTVVSLDNPTGAAGGELLPVLWGVALAAGRDRESGWREDEGRWVTKYSWKCRRLPLKVDCLDVVPLAKVAMNSVDHWSLVIDTDNWR